MVDEALDVLGHQLLGADEHVDRQAVGAEQLGAAGVLGGADAGDLGGRAEQRERHLAGHHVDFVAGGERDDDVRFGSAGRLEHRRVGGVAGDGAHVEPVLQVAQHLLVDVHHRDFVGLLAREVLGGGAADLAGAEDEDLHGAPARAAAPHGDRWRGGYSGSRFAYCTISHLVPWRSKLTCTRACAPVALDVEDDAVAELAVAHARAEAHAGHRRLLGPKAPHRHRARHLHARAHLLDELFGDLAHEARDLPVAVDAVQAPLLGVAQVQAAHGARHADITQAPLLLEAVEVGERALVRKQALLQAGAGTPPGTPAPWRCAASSSARSPPRPPPGLRRTRARRAPGTLPAAAAPLLPG